MGAHASYPLIIYNLVSLKSQFQFISTEKYQGVIKELSSYNIHFNSDNDHLPDPAQLATKLKCDHAKMKKTLKELMNIIINSLNDHPLVVKNIVHILNVSPYVAREDRFTERDKGQWNRAISIPVVLPVTPRIGDHIEIPFIRTSYSYSTDDKFNYGYVHDVSHKINGTIQEIVISIYYENIFYKWEEMKEEYENHKLWLARLKAEKDRF